GRVTDWLTLGGGVDLGLAINDVFVRLPRPPKEGRQQTMVDLDDTVTTQHEGAPYWQPGVFVEAELTPMPGLTILPGLRFDYFDLTGQFLLQPRLTARWQVAPMWTAKGGAGLYAQEPNLDAGGPGLGQPEHGH